MGDVLAIGAVVAGRYQVLRLLARGSMSLVYDVRDQDTSSDRALKVLSTAALGHQELKWRFTREVSIGARLRSPHIVEVVDSGVISETGAPYLVMDRLLGSPLFMAPEQVRFKREVVDTRADIYSFGQLAYCMLVGEPYWQPDNEAADSVMQLVLEIAFGATQAASDRARAREGVQLAAAFDRWFATATSLRAVDRFSSAGRAVSELAEALSCSAPPARAVAGPSPSGEVRTHWVTDNRDARGRATRWKRLVPGGLALGTLVGLFTATALSTGPTASSITTSAALERFTRSLEVAATRAHVSSREAIGASSEPPQPRASTGPRPPGGASTTSEPHRAPNARPASAAVKRPPSQAPAATGQMPAETPTPPAWVAPVTER